MPKNKNEVRTDGKAVFYAVLYPSMRAAALEHGYALCLHGSMARDMDIMAIPWVENVSPVETLVQVISDCIDGTVWKEYHTKKYEHKPHNRTSYTLAIMGDWTIDLSVIKPSHPTPAQEEAVERKEDMTVQEFYSGFNLDFLNEEEKQTIYTATELFAKGKVRIALEQYAGKKG